MICMYIKWIYIYIQTEGFSLPENEKKKKKKEEEEEEINK
jgi:hypothetical protein